MILSAADFVKSRCSFIITSSGLKISRKIINNSRQMYGTTPSSLVITEHADGLASAGTLMTRFGSDTLHERSNGYVFVVNYLQFRHKDKSR